MSKEYVHCIVFLFSIFTFFLAETTFAKELVADGVGLSTPLSINLQKYKGQDILVRASQYYGDFKLSLRETQSSKNIKVVNSVDYKGFDEIMLVEEGDCIRCELILSPTDKIFEHANYKVTIETIEDIAGKGDSYEKVLSFYRTYSKSLELFANAETDYEGDSFDKAIKTLGEIAFTELEHESSLNFDQQVALNLVAEAEDHRYSDKGFENALNRLRKLTENKVNVPRGYALNDLALLEPDFKKKQSIYDEALSIARHQKDARLYAEVANRKAINLTNNAQYQEAIYLLIEAQEINQIERRLLPLVQNLGNLSRACLRAGEVSQAIRYATQMKLIADEYQNSMAIMLALYYSGTAYSRLGEHSLANQFLEEALQEYTKRSTTEEAFDSASFDIVRAAVLEEQAQQLLAYEDYESAFEKAVAARDMYSRLNRDVNVANLRYWIAQIEWKLGHKDLARTKLKRAIEYDTKHNRNRSLGRQYATLAELELADGNYVQAAGHINSAMNILSEIEDKETLLRTVSTAIELLSVLGGVDQAWQIGQKLNNSHLLAFLPESDLAELYYRLSIVAINSNRNKEAMSYLASAREKIELALPKIKRRDLRRKFLAIQKSIYEKSIELLMQSDTQDIKQALLLAESFKARTLEESLSDDLSFSRIPKAMKGERDKIHAQLLTFAMSVHEPNAIGAEFVLSKAKETSESLAVLEQSILNIKQSVPKQTRLDLDIISLDPQQYLVFYFLGKEKSWVWSISQKGIKAYSLPKKDKIKQKVEKYLSLVSTPPGQRNQQGMQFGVTASNDLAKSLLGPMTEELFNSNISEIIIVPDDLLFGVPFSALSLDGNSYLIENFSLSAVPSIGVREQLLKTEKTRTQPDHTALIFANAGFDEPSQTSFGTLPFSEIEGEEIKKMFGDGSLMFKGSKANRVNLSKFINRHYGVIHFATHGLIDSDVPNLSGLSFPKENGETSLWLLPEISTAKINANLVFLSGCETALGDSVAGEGLMSLGRAFLEAGANNVIGTLWNVEDRATSLLVQNFYKALTSERKNFVNALQQSMKELISKNYRGLSDPYYWAGFQLIGGSGNSIDVDRVH